jgi:hypothetical protein
VRHAVLAAPQAWPGAVARWPADAGLGEVRLRDGAAKPDEPLEPDEPLAAPAQAGLPGARPALELDEQALAWAVPAHF